MLRLKGSSLLEVLIALTIIVFSFSLVTLFIAKWGKNNEKLLVLQTKYFVERMISETDTDEKIIHLQKKMRIVKSRKKYTDHVDIIEVVVWQGEQLIDNRKRLVYEY
jgi:hypothetical protein